MKTDPSCLLATECAKKMELVNRNCVEINTNDKRASCSKQWTDGVFMRRSEVKVRSVNHEVSLMLNIRKGTDLSILGFDRKKYSGSVVGEIKQLYCSGQRLVHFANIEQMKTVNSNVTIYNNRHKNKTGFKVKCRYDYNNLLILFYLSPFLQASLEESQSCQEEQLYVPP